MKYARYWTTELQPMSMKTDNKEKTKAKKEKIRLKDRISAWLFLLPSFAGVMVFFVAPFFVVIYYSTIDNIINRESVGLANIKALLANSAFRDAAKNSLSFSLMAVPLAIILSLLMALALESNIPLKSRFRTFFLSPLMVPTASVLLIWQVLFDHHGVVNEWIKLIGKNPVDWLKSDYSQIVVLLLFLWKNLGYNMILFMSALAAIPRDVLEVAELDGASGFKKFFKIKLKFITPTIFFVGIMSLINSFKVFREVYLLTGDYPYETLYMLQHFMNNKFSSFDYQMLSAAAIIMAVVIVAIIGALFYAENRFGKDVEQ